MKDFSHPRYLHCRVLIFSKEATRALSFFVLFCVSLSPTSENLYTDVLFFWMVFRETNGTTYFGVPI